MLKGRQFRNKNTNNMFMFELKTEGRDVFLGCELNEGLGNGGPSQSCSWHGINLTGSFPFLSSFIAFVHLIYFLRRCCSVFSISWVQAELISLP